MRHRLDHPRQLAQAEHAAVGHVADVGVAHEREEVVLADAVEGDVADEHDLVVLFVEGLREVHPRILPEAAEHLGVHPRHAGGRFEQAFAVGILPDGGEDFTDGPLDAGVVDGVGFCHRVLTLPTATDAPRGPCVCGGTRPDADVVAPAPRTIGTTPPWSQLSLKSGGKVRRRPPAPRAAIASIRSLVRAKMSVSASSLSFVSKSRSIV